MTRAATISLRSKALFGAAIGVGVVAALAFGAAPDRRGPIDPTLLPQMAEHPVALPDGAQLFVQKYEVSVAEWNLCHAAGGCRLALRAPAGRAETDTPATGLSYVDVTEYVAWISAASGHSFRLPTLSEWEHMAEEVLPEEPDPIFTSPELSWASAYLTEPQIARTLRERGAFATTAEGIVDLNGSVWEWTQDCYAGESTAGGDADRCPAYFVGGEHVAAIPFLVSDPQRGGCAVGAPPAHLGMRLVSDERS